MGAIARFLLALNRLARNKGIKIEDAYKFAKQEFGEVTPLLRKQIQKVFDKVKKPVVGKPDKKEGTVLPMVKEGAKKAEGIETLEEGSPLMDRLDKKVEDVRQDFVNPKRPGGSLDPATGITRALARRILDRKGIEIGKKDPIDVFTDTFGEAISDVNNLAEEMIEIDARGGGMKDMDQMLEIEGLFDIEIPKNPQRGLTDEELLEMVKKDAKEKEMLKDFDPTFRKPNAEGGLTRTSYAMGKGPVLPSDEDPINPFQPTPTGPVLPDKSMMADLGDEFISPEYQEEFRKFLMMLQESEKEQSRDNIMEMFKKYMLTKEPRVLEAATGGRVQAASGGLADILKV